MPKINEKEKPELKENPSVENKESQKDVPDKKLSEIGQSVETGVALTEGDVETSGKVSEVLGETASENQSTGPGPKTGAQAKKMTDEEKRLHLLNNAPPVMEMRREIRGSLTKQFKELNKDLKKEQKQGNYFRVHAIVANMRKIKTLLAKIVTLPLKALKELWLKIVHGL